MELQDHSLADVERLQWLAFGMALANKNHRAMMGPEDFVFDEFESAFYSLLDGEYRALERLLDVANVQWASDAGHPVTAVISSLKRDARFHHMIAQANRIIKTHLHPDVVRHRKIQFVEEMSCLLATTDAKLAERANLPAALAAANAPPKRPPDE